MTFWRWALVAGASFLLAVAVTVAGLVALRPVVSPGHGEPVPLLAPPYFTSAEVVEAERCDQWGAQPGKLVHPDLAGEEYYWSTPQQVCRLADSDGDPDQIALVIQGRADTLGIGTALDRSGAFRLLAGSCAEHPEAACISTWYVNDPTVDWQGLTEVTSATSRDVYINLAGIGGAPPPDRHDLAHVVCHEVLHGVGVSHHWSDFGCAGPNWGQTTPSEAEIAAAGR